MGYTFGNSLVGAGNSLRPGCDRAGVAPRFRLCDHPSQAPPHWMRHMAPCDFWSSQCVKTCTQALHLVSRQMKHFLGGLFQEKQ